MTMGGITNNKYTSRTVIQIITCLFDK